MKRASIITVFNLTYHFCMYNETLRDLLVSDVASPKKLDLQHDSHGGVRVSNLSVYDLASAAHGVSLVETGCRARSVGTRRFSKRHSSFVLFVMQPPPPLSPIRRDQHERALQPLAPDYLHISPQQEQVHGHHKKQQNVQRMLRVCPRHALLNVAAAGISSTLRARKTSPKAVPRASGEQKRSASIRV